MNSLPNLFIVGAARAGTTALYEMLRSHPEIYFPRLKEPKHFTYSQEDGPHLGKGDLSIDRAVVKTWSEYIDLYSDASKFVIRGDASPNYLYEYEKAIPRIKSKIGDPKILIVLRNPALRALSAYNYLLRDSRENLSFKKALKLEQERINSNYDFIWHYYNVGLYSQQVKAYKENFTSVKVIFSEDLRGDGVSELNNVLEWLGVDGAYNVHKETSYNPVGSPSNLFVKTLLRRDIDLIVRLREILKNLIPRYIIESCVNKYLRKENVPSEELKSLLESYSEDKIKIEELLGRAVPW